VTASRRLPDAGGWRVDLLEAGSLAMQAGLLAPEEELPGPRRVPVNVLLLRGHGRTVLLDAGSGPLVHWWEEARDELSGALRAAGADAAEVDLVVLSHLDFDHAAGTLAGGWPDALEPAFPRARVRVSQEAAAAARGRDPDEEGNAGTRCVQVLERAGLLEEAAGDEELAPGLRLRLAPGHRAGHACIEVADGLVYVADLIHHPLHVPHPEWDEPFDSDPEQALVTRRRVLAELAGSGRVVVATHVAGAGTVEGEPSSPTWRQTS
jgi:glyoxylase-like metal-dependent hydrolase (beta-lactamase superfamily II)